MDASTLMWLFLAAVIASTLGGLLGMAGGVFIVPMLTIVGGMSIHTAIGASLVSVIACSCGSASAYLRGRLTNIRLAIVLEVATTLGALSGVLIFGIVPSRVLYLLFAVVMVVSAGQMVTRRREAVTLRESSARLTSLLRLDGHVFDDAQGKVVPYTVQKLPLGMTLMYLAGLLSSLLGIGSGVLKIPAMDAALRLPIKVSTATSNVMIGVTAAASAAAYFVRGDLDTNIAAPIVLGSAAGSMVGANLLMRMSSERLRKLFVGVMILMAVQMLLRAGAIDSGIGGWA